MTDTQTPEDQAADLDDVERDAIHWWDWKLPFTTMNIMAGLFYPKILRWNNFTLASFLPFPNRMSTSPSQLTPTFTSCSGLYSGNQIRMIKNVALQYMFSKE